MPVTPRGVVRLPRRPGEDVGGLPRRLCDGRLADFKRPRTLELVDALPREPNGKVLKWQLREERSGTGPRGTGQAAIEP